MAGTTTGADAGAPGVVARRAAIYEAALDVLVEEGYDRMTMDAVAARAHASKATIYRHWSGKQELVVEALRHRGPLPVCMPDTGSLREDVLATLRLMASFLLDDEGTILCRAVGAVRRAPEVADAVRRELIDARHGIARTMVARAVERGDLPPGVDPDVFEAVAPPLIFFRLNVLREPADEEFLAHVADDVLLPLMSRVVRATDDSGARASSSLRTERDREPADQSQEDGPRTDPAATDLTEPDRALPGRAPTDLMRPLARSDQKEPA